MTNQGVNSSTSISSFIVFKNPVIHRCTRKQAIFHCVQTIPPPLPVSEAATVIGTFGRLEA
jgi:hypothetical protein